MYLSKHTLSQDSEQHSSTHLHGLPPVGHAERSVGLRDRTAFSLIAAQELHGGVALHHCCQLPGQVVSVLQERAPAGLGSGMVLMLAQGSGGAACPGCKQDRAGITRQPGVLQLQVRQDCPAVIAHSRP